MTIVIEGSTPQNEKFVQQALKAYLLDNPNTKLSDMLKGTMYLTDLRQSKDPNSTKVSYDIVGFDEKKNPVCFTVRCSNHAFKAEAIKEKTLVQMSPETQEMVADIQQTLNTNMKIK